MLHSPDSLPKLLRILDLEPFDASPLPAPLHKLLIQRMQLQAELRSKANFVEVEVC